MANPIITLMKHYGIDEAKPQASKQLLKRIKKDMAQYQAQGQMAVECDKTHDRTTTKGAKRETFLTGRYRVKKTQSLISGNSLGRSTGPIKLAGANKRTGAGREHGECAGASARTKTELIPMKEVRTTEYKKTKTGPSINTQVEGIVMAYTALLELLE